MLLAHDGKLRYEQTLTEIFPDFPAYGKAITVRHLLTHTGGLPDYEDLMDELERGKPPIWTAARQIHDQEVLELLKHQTHAKFTAGSSWDYSNSGYVVLGLIVAKVSGQPFADFLRARIFQPLRMESTLAFIAGKNTVPNRAFGHSRKDGSLVETDQSATSATLGDGGVYSNLDDLAKWDAALAAHTPPIREMEPAHSGEAAGEGDVLARGRAATPRPGEAGVLAGWFPDPAAANGGWA